MALALAVLVVTGGYWYWSPALALHNMRTAAKNGDADEFNNYVDYPKLRENLKGYLSGQITQAMGDGPGDKSGMGALGAALGVALVGGMVDAFVRPENVMQAMQSGKLGKYKEQRTSPSSQPERAPPSVETERKGMDKFVVHLREQGATDELASLVMERSSFATWKLTEVRPAFSKR